MKKLHLAALAWLALASPALASQGSGCLPTTGTVSGLSMTQYINAAIAALTSSFSGAAAPSTDCTAAPVKGQIWLDTSVTPNVEKRYDGTNWVAVGAIDSSNHLWSPPVGGGTASITAAPTTDICATPPAVQNISGTTTITSFGSGCVVGARKTLIFGGATPITYNAGSMIIPGQRSYTTAAGDIADVLYLGSGNWRIRDIAKIDGSSVTNPAVPMATVLYGDFASIPPKTLVGTGQAVSRSGYPDYLQAVTRVQAGTLTAGNNTITSLANTRGLGPGMPLEGSGIPSGSTIASVTSSTVVMTTTATTSGSQTVTVFTTGYGAGGDSTTVGVKNCTGKVIAGLDPTGSSLGSASALNTAQGSKDHTLTVAQMPAHAHGVTDPGHAHNGAGSGTDGVVIGSTYVTWNIGGNSNYTNYPPTQAAVTGISIQNNGGGAAHPIVQPTVIAECVVVVLP